MELLETCLYVTLFLDSLTGGAMAWCSSDWEMGGYCYFPFRTWLSFDLAQDSCHQIDANLTSIHSAEEQTLIVAMAAGREDNNFWVGLRRMDGVYKWIDGTGNYNMASRWLQRTTRGDCVVLAGSFLATRSCSNYYYYVCRKPAEITTISTTSTSITTSTTSIYITIPPTSTSTTTSTAAMTTPAISTTTTSTLTIPTTTTTSSTTTTTTTIPTTTRPATTMSIVAPITRVTPSDILDSLVWVRKKSETESIPDNRPSAVGIGAFGVFIMVAILVTVFLMDIGIFVKHFRWMRRNLKQFCRRHQEPAVLYINEKDRL